MQSGGGKADSSPPRAVLVIWAPTAQAGKPDPLVSGSRPALLASGTCVSAGSLEGPEQIELIHRPHLRSPICPPIQTQNSSAKKKKKNTHPEMHSRFHFCRLLPEAANSET